jgi:hypothetical protein
MLGNAWWSLGVLCIKNARKHLTIAKHFQDKK